MVAYFSIAKAMLWLPVVVGVLISVILKDWTLLQRLACVQIAVSLILFKYFDDFVENYKAQVRDFHSMLAGERPPMTKSEEYAISVINNNTNKSKGDVDKQLQFTDKIAANMRSMELNAGVCGTILAGFGDLPNTFY